MQAEVPKLPGLLASGWGQPEGGHNGRPERWGKEKPGSLLHTWP